MSRNTKNAILALAALIVLASAMLIIYTVYMPSAQAGVKNIELLIIHSDGSEKRLSLRTDAETLRAAMEKEELISGEEGPYGLFVRTVDGESVDESKQQWWCFTKGGESLMTGVDDTMISDGDSYEICFTVGW